MNYSLPSTFNIAPGSVLIVAHPNANAQINGVSNIFRNAFVVPISNATMNQINTQRNYDPMYNNTLNGTPIVNTTISNTPLSAMPNPNYSLLSSALTPTQPISINAANISAMPSYHSHRQPKTEPQTTTVVCCDQTRPSLQSKASSLRNASSHSGMEISMPSLSSSSSSTSTASSVLQTQTQRLPVLDKRPQLQPSEERLMYEADATNQTSLTTTAIDDNPTTTNNTSNRASVNDNGFIILDPNIPIRAEEVKRRCNFYDATVPNQPWRCPFSNCNKRYSRKRSLDNHFKVHTLDAYVCECGKKFGRNCNLIEHQRIHSCVKPYKCSYCGKAFSQSHCLTEHIRTHTKQKPFECLVCHKKFAVRSNLKVHELTHDPNKPVLVCPHCSKEFSSQNGYKKHIQTRH